MPLEPLFFNYRKNSYPRARSGMRSRRAELPHRALTLNVWRRSALWEKCFTGFTKRQEPLVYGSLLGEYPEFAPNV